MQGISAVGAPFSGMWALRPTARTLFCYTAALPTGRATAPGLLINANRHEQQGRPNATDLPAPSHAGIRTTRPNFCAAMPADFDCSNRGMSSAVYRQAVQH